MEMVESEDDLETSRSVGRPTFHHFEILDARIASALEKIIINSLLHEEGQSGGAKGPNGRPTSPWKTDCVYDLRILSGSWST